MTDKFIDEPKSNYYIVHRRTYPDDWDVYTVNVFSDMASYANGSGQCFATQETIAKDCKISTSKVKNCIKYLCICGYIKDLTPNKRYFKAYEIVDRGHTVTSKSPPDLPKSPQDFEGTTGLRGHVAPTESKDKLSIKINRIKKVSSAEESSAQHTLDASLYSEENPLKALQDKVGKIKGIEPKNCLYIAANVLADVIGTSFQTLPKERQGGLCNAVKRHAKTYDMDITDPSTMEALANLYQQIFGKEGIWYDEFTCKKIGWPFHGKEGDMSPPTEKQISAVWGTTYIKKIFDRKQKN